MLITKYAPDDVNVPWLEEDIQAHIVKEMRRLGILFRVGMEGIKLTVGQAMKAKALGMERGEPDILIYTPRLVLVELKRKKGTVSTEQEARINLLRKAGYEVHIIKRATPHEAWCELKEILNV